MAEWLRTGLQIRLRRFDSGSGLQGSKRFAALAQLVEHIIRNVLAEPQKIAEIQ